jgi:phosphopantetheinyl transferase (holo-ACP synthase)
VNAGRPRPGPQAQSAHLLVELALLDDLPPEDDGRWRLWLCADEIAYCLGFQRATEHLAARVAAKRAVARAMDCAAVPWHQIEIRRAPHRAPEVVVSGPLDDRRRGQALAVPGVSLSHAGGRAAAVVWLPPPP